MRCSSSAVHFMPNCAATAAVWRTWLDCTAPWVTRCVGALRLRLAHQEFQLAHLVAAGGHHGAVVALDPELRPAEMSRQTGQRFERRRQVTQTHARKAIQLQQRLAPQRWRARNASTSALKVAACSKYGEWPASGIDLRLAAGQGCRDGACQEGWKDHVLAAGNQQGRHGEILEFGKRAPGGAAQAGAHLLLVEVPAMSSMLR